MLVKAAQVNSYSFVIYNQWNPSQQLQNIICVTLHTLYGNFETERDRILLSMEKIPNKHTHVLSYNSANQQKYGSTY